MAVPAVLESGAETKFCVSVLELTEPVVVNVTLKSTAKSTTLMSLHTCIQDVHTCIAFSVSFPKEAFFGKTFQAFGFIYTYIYIYICRLFLKEFFSLLIIHMTLTEKLESEMCDVQVSFETCAHLATG